MSDFTMEELIPTVAWLVEKYTSKESTSVPYETAERLMEAVLYCMREAGDGAGLVTTTKSGSARELYDWGYQCVLEKTKRTKTLYEALLEDFESYGNLCLADTILKGMPAFFTAYDPRFYPQNHILTLDYPTIRGLEGACGVDAIERYLRYVALEQQFLRQFPRDYVRRELAGYEELFVNLCEIVLRNVLGSMICGRKMTEASFGEKDYAVMEQWAAGCTDEELKLRIRQMIRLLSEKTCPGEPEIADYLAGAADDFCVTLRQAAESHSLEGVFWPVGYGL